MTEPTNKNEIIESPTNEASTRRGFLQKWGPKVGIGAAAILALKEVKGASAVSPCGYAWKYVTISPCQSHLYRCEVSCQTGAYYNCVDYGIVNHNNCAAYGYSSHCCGN